MQYVSTNNNTPPVSLRKAVDRCIADDGGLYMPRTIPVIPQAFFNNIGEMGLRDIAYIVATSFFGDALPASTLKTIVDESFSVDAPLLELDKDIFVLELFHGPTLTFKDYGARFLGRLIRALDGNVTRPQHRNVLIATTGNTGGATSNGLYRFDDISVTVLYPRGQLAGAQKAQLTALGENIYPVEVTGTIEDCKALVNSAFSDTSFEHYNITGANSINIGRLIPQISFALYAYARLRAIGHPRANDAFYCIPGGNLSNLVAAAMALRMGLPCSMLTGATGANDQLKPCLDGKTPSRRRPVSTLAPSIDMSTPSGWPRLRCLYNGDIAAMRRHITASAPVGDEQISLTVNGLRQRHRYTIDPHGAVAYAAALATDAPGAPKVVYATGHPAKQLDIMTRITGSAIEMPVQLNRFMSPRRQPVIIPPTLPALKKHLQSLH